MWRYAIGSILASVGVISNVKILAQPVANNNSNDEPKPAVSRSKLVNNLNSVRSTNLKTNVSLLLKTTSHDDTNLFQPLEHTYEQSKDPKQRPVCVLVLDGGGLRGVVTCEILKQLERHIQIISGDENIKISDAFDLIVGTSTGGLLSIGLGRLDWNVDKCSNLYDKMATNVFGGIEHSYGNTLDRIYDIGLNGLHTSKSILNSFTRGTFSMYSSQKFRETLLKEIGVGENEPLYINKEENIKNRKPLVAAIATEVSWAAHAYPAVLRSYSLHNEYVTQMPFFPGTSTASIITAAMATSAAPSYFDPVFLDVPDPNSKNNTVKHQLVDGGLNSNDPVMIAFCEAKVLWPDRKIFLLSIGTGQIDIDLKNPPKGGFFAISELVKTSFNSLFSAKESTNYITISVLGFLDILDCVRLNPKIDKTKTAMDNPSLMKYWRTTGEDYAKQQKIDEVLHDVAVVALQCQQTSNIINEAKI